MRIKKPCNYIIVCCLLVIPGSGLKAQSATEKELFTQTSETAGLMINYREDIRAIKDFYSPERPDYRSRGGYNTIQYSPEQSRRLTEVNELYLTQLKSKDFASMSINGKADYILTQRDIESALRLLAADEKEYQQISQYIPFADKIYALEKGRRRGVSVDGQKTAALFTAMVTEVQAATDAMSKVPSLDMKLAERLRVSIEGLKLRLKSVYDFYNGYDPLFTWWVPEPNTALVEKLTNYATLVKTKGKVETSQKDDKSGIVGIPIGHDELIRQLKVEMINYTPEELIDIANKEFAWCDKEMLKASNEMGYGNDWKKALEKVKNSYVPAGQQPELIMKLYNKSIDFVTSRDMITIPALAQETWGMIMMTPERQLVNPFFTGGKEISISYPTNTMSNDDKMMSMRGNNPYFSTPTVQHELLPGHNLQYFMNSRSKNYRDFNTPFWTEGWALYWEMLLYDKGFAVTPEERVGMLFWRMHRCARIIFSLNYHLGKWTPQQCIDFLVDRVGHEKANAEGEVRRSFVGGYSPLYQVAYLIGGLEFYALKKELVDSGKMTLKEYHDKVMLENNMPVEMVRAILTNQNIDKNFKTSWRFYSSR
ncbi:DUF885 family protein [Pedobacter sp. L105]|uniref:DUF885 family protein n=1 Tax=Pedobacter sp. L105 TaxID=1641871 RepID=UPI00131D274B|nr:DUF885 family protein [Pedobacter sp. L105]